MTLSFLKRARCSAVVLILGACHSAERGVSTESREFAPGVAAVVGSDPITIREIADVAASGKRSLTEARDAVLRDALFAAHAQEEAPEEVTSATTRVLARAMLHRFAADARAKPIDDTELENWKQARFVDVDRPPGWRVVHGVVVVPGSSAPEEIAAARLYAAHLRATVEPIVRAAAATPPVPRVGRDVFLDHPDMPEDRVAERFRVAMAALEHGSLDTRFEALGVVSADGRCINYGKSPWDRLLDEFTTAASALLARGDVSPVVETKFESSGKLLLGFHVIALLERTPEHRLDRAGVLAALLPEIHDSRAREAHAEFIERAARRAKVAIERNAGALLEALAFEEKPN